jgi:hypothetical protein
LQAEDFLEKQAFKDISRQRQNIKHICETINSFQKHISSDEIVYFLEETVKYVRFCHECCKQYTYVYKPEFIDLVNRETFQSLNHMIKMVDLLKLNQIELHDFQVQLIQWESLCYYIPGLE